MYQDPVTGYIILTRYNDVRKVLLNPSIFSNRTAFLGNRWALEANALFEKKGWLPIDTLVSTDPPEHRRFRAPVDKVFTSRKVVGLEPRINEIIDSLIDAFPASGEMDFVARFAVPLQMYVIAELLGVSPNDFGPSTPGPIRWWNRWIPPFRSPGSWNWLKS